MMKSYCVKQETNRMCRTFGLQNCQKWETYVLVHLRWMRNKKVQIGKEGKLGAIYLTPL